METVIGQATELYLLTGLKTVGDSITWDSTIRKVVGWRAGYGSEFYPLVVPLGDPMKNPHAADGTKSYTVQQFVTSLGTAMQLAGATTCRCGSNAEANR